MPLILNPLNLDILDRAQSLKQGLICLSGPAGSGKAKSLEALMDALEDSGKAPELISVIGEIRTERNVWEMDSVIETGVVLTTVMANDALESIFQLFKCKAEPETWSKIEVGSVFSCQTLVCSLRDMATVSYAQVAENNGDNPEFADLMVRIEKAAAGRDTSKIRFADVIQIADESSAIIHGILMGSPGDEESNKAWNEFTRRNPATARMLRPHHYVASEVIVVDDRLHELLIAGRLIDIRDYVQSLNLPTQKDVAIDEMLLGNIDPTELELIFGLLN
jgi:hypothetical protein